MLSGRCISERDPSASCVIFAIRVFDVEIFLLNMIRFYIEGWQPVIFLLVSCQSLNKLLLSPEIIL